MNDQNAAMKKSSSAAPMPVPLKVYESYFPTKGQSRYLFFKRAFDFLFSLLMLVGLSPLLFLTALCVKLTSRGPALFRQKRVGKNGKTIMVYKFRTMSVEAPHEKSTAGFEDAERYITPIGRMLRKASLDELPQLLNILKGDMSFIGPRPLILSEENIHAMRFRNGVYFLRPGLTGIAQVNGRDLVSPEQKVEYDTQYLHTFGLKTDARVFLHTLLAVFRRYGVVEGSEQVNLEECIRQSAPPVPPEPEEVPAPERIQEKPNYI